MFNDLFLYLYCLQLAAVFIHYPAVPRLENQRGPDVKTLIQEVVKNNVGSMMCVRLNLFLCVVVRLFMQATTEKVSAQGRFVCDQAVLISDMAGSCT